MITLISNGDGTYTEHVPSPDFPDATVTWVRDSYTEPRETVFNCDDCGGQITEWYFWTCMDGGEAAHLGCVTVVPCEVNDCNREAWLCACGNAHCNQHPHISDGNNPGETEPPRHPDAYPEGESWGPDNPAPGSPWSRKKET